MKDLIDPLLVSLISVISLDLGWRLPPKEVNLMESGIDERNTKGVAMGRQIAPVNLCECSGVALGSHRSGRGHVVARWS